MKKLFLLGFILFSTIGFVFSQVGYVPGSNQGTGIVNPWGTAFGTQNQALGQYSVVGGSNSKALGSHSFGFGQSVVSEGFGSFALGNHVKANAENSWVLGTGFYSKYGWNEYINSTANSMAIGFNMSNRPSVFIQPFSEDGTGDGFVGIQTSTPTSELDVAGTITTNGLILEPVFGGGVITPGDVLTALDSDGTVGWVTPSNAGGGESLWTENPSNNNIYYYNGLGNVGIGSNANPTAFLHC